VARKLVILFLVGVGLLGLGAGVTFVALEANEVVVLRTFGPTGDELDARVWVVDDGTETWIEIANPEKELYRRVLENPNVEMVRRDEARRFRAVPDTSRASHERVRALLARKYGLADRWIGMLVDTSASVPVRLVPVPAHDEANGS